MAYLAPTDVEQFLNITLTDNGTALVTSLIAAVSAFVENETGRNWNSDADTDIVEIFDGGQEFYFPNNIPITQITSVLVDGEIFAAVDVLNYKTYIKLAYPPFPGNQNVVITYRTGATKIPADLKFALTMWVGQLFKSQTDAGKTVDSVNTGNISVHYVTKEGVPAFVTEVIDNYKIFSF